ncbi:efflux RND transporter permease subunit [Lichenifustis flavocetrariae]|uniref:Efflux RND transporter permease subunit n=1 Tax=Lichenifustis flavocetrariae TaxID=2949735 RepID=A0AA41YZY2_9HYPH|nr:efflux RND transporter permease subunit [Lichenifustis flavocetrariae]MCW6510327.1 efflux RND transporter permease subunit [Lichenifustis flavocetrariae]
MSISDLFIRRPIGTTLLSVGLFLIGAVAYFQLPVASLPGIDFPAIRVNASRPGADPATMAATVAAPLERRLGEIAGVNELTSSSSLGASSISIQFDMTRNVDDAARDVQAALNAAATDLPSDLPSLPTYRKANSAAFPVLILALTSKSLPNTALYDAADTVIAQKISQVEGVAEVTVNGAEQPAIRVRIDPQRLAAMGLSVDAVRTALTNANPGQPVGSFDGADQSETLATSDRMSTPEEFGAIVVRAENNTIVRLRDIADVARGVKSRRAAGWYNKDPSVLLIITKQPAANVIDTVDRVKDLLPQLRRWIPAGVEISIFTDRTVSIRAAVRDIQLTLLLTVALVMGVVLIFLRRATPTLAAGVAVPLSLAGTVACMWVAGFSLDNLSLMAITISVGFVVDDAIVMIENVARNMEKGMTAMQAAFVGARQIGFTVISISLSLVAAFVPLVFMGGIVGSLFREFSLTLTFAVLISTLVSLTLTPMLCGHFMKDEHGRAPTRFDRIVEGVLGAIVGTYAWTLRVALRHPWMMLLVMVLTIALTVELFKTAPKGFVPNDDTGLIMGMTEAAPSVSFPEMSRLQQNLAAGVLTDPAVDGVGSFIGGGGNSSVNQGRLFISLKDEDARPPIEEVIARLRRKLSHTPGITLFMVAIQDLKAGARSGKGSYQYTLWDPDLDELQEWQTKVLERLRKVPGLVDVSTDREQGGLEARIVIDRAAASRLGVPIQAIDDALNDAFGERQVSTIYTQRNQYHVVLEVATRDQRDPADLSRIYVPGTAGVQVPLGAFTRIERGTSALVVNHQGAFPSVTISYNLQPDASLDLTSQAVTQAVAEMHLPDGLHADFSGDALVFQQGASNQIILLLAALGAIYIILGVLYESLVHPLTILSTLPSAGLGALLALRLVNMELTVIAFVGIILLIGIVKKNGIMLVDFAIHAERDQGMTPRDAIYAACLERFRPILMTTLAALFGAMPIAFGTGVGAELRRPLGVTIMGGLILSQALTLYTTPIIYLGMARMSARWRARRGHVPTLLPAPGE